MPEGGTIRIEARHHQEPGLVTNGDTEPGGLVRLTVTDTGTGMALR